MATGDDSAANVAAAIWPLDYPAPARVIRCRHCAQKNRVMVPLAATVPHKHSCGSCGAQLFLSLDEPLTGLSSVSYQHSLDRRSLAALRAVPGAASLVRWLLESFGDRGARMMFMSDAIHCNEEQFPELLALMNQARSRLGVDLQPTLFLGESPHMNAMTTGVAEPVVVVRSALLDQMNNSELIAVLGHELGHLQSDHPLYHSVAQLLLHGGASASQLFRVLSSPIHRVVLRWARCAELTADRAALLASRDLHACISMMLIFAGGNRPGTSSRTQIRLAPFIRQCRELARIQTWRSFEGLLGAYMTLDRTHPHVAWRVMHLLQWVEHGNYLNILSGQYIRRKVERRLLPRATPNRTQPERP